MAGWVVGGFALSVFDAWLARKLNRRRGTLRAAKTVEEKFSRIYGPKADFAWVMMTGEPSGEFGFRSLAAWPEDPAEYEDDVLDGILDELLASGAGMTVLNARFTLEEIKWHPVDGNRHAFYRAARAATQAILSINEYPGNVVATG